VISRTQFIAIALPELEEIIDRIENKVKHPATQRTEIKVIDESGYKTPPKAIALDRLDAA
jgi:hypothetical protein